jgi:hypothetical protein
MILLPCAVSLIKCVVGESRCALIVDDSFLFGKQSLRLSVEDLVA